MELALGVAVSGPVARLALIESGPDGHGVVDESVVDLAEDPIARLTETVVGTNRSLADQYHQLVATRLCWSDQHRANELRQVLDNSGLQNVVVLPDFQAAAAFSRSRASSLPLAVPDDPDFAIARGAALDAATGRPTYPAGDATMAAPVTLAGQPAYPAGDATALAPAASTGPVSHPAGDATALAPMGGAAMGAEDATVHAPAAAATGSSPQLAYSQEDGDPELPPMEYGGEDEYGELDAAAPPAGRALLVGSAVGGILVAGIAALAVAVTIGVRPTAATHPQPPAPAQQKSVPGNFVPALPAPTPGVLPEPAPAPDAVVPQNDSGPAPAGGGGAPEQVPPPPPAVDPGVAPPPPAVVPVPVPIPIPFPIPNTTGGTTTGTTTGGTTTGGTTTGTTTGTTGGTTGTTGGTTTGGTTGATTGTTTGTTTGSSSGTSSGSSSTGSSTGGVTTGASTGTSTGSGTTGTSSGSSSSGTSSGSSSTGSSTGGVTTGASTGTSTGSGTTGTSTGGSKGLGPAPKTCGTITNPCG